MLGLAADYSGSAKCKLSVIGNMLVNRTNVQSALGLVKDKDMKELSIWDVCVFCCELE